MKLDRYAGMSEGIWRDRRPVRAIKNPLRTTGLVMLAEWTGLEPATPGVTGRYSDQLNYHSSGSCRMPAQPGRATLCNVCRYI